MSACTHLHWWNCDISVYADSLWSFWNNYTQMWPLSVCAVVSWVIEFMTFAWFPVIVMSCVWNLMWNVGVVNLNLFQRTQRSPGSSFLASANWLCSELWRLRLERRLSAQHRRGVFLNIRWKLVAVWRLFFICWHEWWGNSCNIRHSVELRFWGSADKEKPNPRRIISAAGCRV